ncbi:hypothetical protein [Lysobacter auxotrophicus]|uniref:Lipoprotein n=1 Tax=Lysobacter auxotrophicus TaxID=2992573 RepID=A0ABM8DBG5_9GAMM|nr:hypothetical protein [Lysobacter auxotrophicus]BDU15873.1 hypothetical protein LA521A_10740 [Lysobacter auxotrophicus]
MNASLRMALLLSLVGLSACAGMESKSTYVPQQRSPSLNDADEEYIAYVERVARRRGLEVVWVNLPRATAEQAEQTTGQPK